MPQKMKNSKIKPILSFISIAITTFALFMTDSFTIHFSPLKIIGGYSSIILISIFLYSFPLSTYISALLFDISAVVFGTIFEFYKSYDFYDKIVHFLSGILLADCGIILISRLLKKSVPSFPLAIIFSFLFASSCAMFWEVYEFSTDLILKTKMQGQNSNTMGDMISGIFGAFLYLSIYFIINIKNKRRQKL